MSNLRTTLKTLLAFFLSSLGSIASFGLILALLWSFNGNEPSYKVITSLISASLSITLGGITIAWITKQNNHVLPAFLGLVTGFSSSLYILGVSLLVIPSTLLAATLAVFGSYLYQSINQRKPSLNLHNG